MSIMNELKKEITRLARKAFLVLSCLLLSGCGTISDIKPTRPSQNQTTLPAIDVSKYESITIMDIEDCVSKANASSNETAKKQEEVKKASKYFADRIAAELRKRKIFKTVTRGGCTGDSLVIQGYITRYKEGSPALRVFVGFGAGSSYLDAELMFTDNLSKRELGTLVVDKHSLFLGLGCMFAANHTPEKYMREAARKISTQLQAGRNQPRKDIPDPTAEEAVVYVYRHSKSVGSAAAPDIRDNGVEIAHIKNGSFFFIHVDPGQHVFSSAAVPNASQSIQVEAGKTYYIKMDVSMSGFKMEVPNKTEAMKAIPQLRLLP